MRVANCFEAWDSETWDSETWDSEAEDGIRSDKATVSSR